LLGEKKKLGEGLGTLLHHGLEMMDSVSTYKLSPHYVLINCESTFSGPWCSNVPRPFPDFSPWLMKY